jgi:hypothetical protein
MNGQTLLFQTIGNYVLGDQYPDSQLELIKFLLEAGADPNEEDCIGCTAQDHLDYEIEYEDLTVHQKEIIRLLNEAGALVRVCDDIGNPVGERGDGASLHEQAALQNSGPYTTVVD